MTVFYKVGIAWCAIGIIGTILYIYAEYLDGSDITIKDIVFLLIAGMSFGIFMFVVSFALFIHTGLSRLEKIEIIRKRNKIND